MTTKFGKKAKPRKEIKRRRDVNGRILPSEDKVLELNIRPGTNDTFPDEVKDAAKREFILGKTYSEMADTLRKLFNPVPSAATFCRWRKKYDWDRARNIFERGVRRRTLEAIPDTVAQTRASAYQLWDEIEIRIRAKLYVVGGKGKNRIAPRMDIPARELKLLVDSLYKVTQMKVLLNCEREEIIKDVDFTLRDIQDTYEDSRKKKKKLTRDKPPKVLIQDPECGFMPPTQIAEDAKSGFDDLE